MFIQQVFIDVSSVPVAAADAANLYGKDDAKW